MIMNIQTICIQLRYYNLRFPTMFEANRNWNPRNNYNYSAVDDNLNVSFISFGNNSKRVSRRRQERIKMVKYNCRRSGV